MKIPHPERVHVIKLPSDGYWYGNMAVLSSLESQSFTFNYWRPFIRQHWFSLGARGIVTVDTIGEAHGIGASVEVIKGDPNIFRIKNNYFSRYYSYEELHKMNVPTNEYLEEGSPYQIGYMVPGERTYRSIAKIAVAESLVEYSTTEGMMSIMKRELHRP